MTNTFLLKSKLNVLNNLNKHGIIIHNVISCSYVSAFSLLLCFVFLVFPAVLLVVKSAFLNFFFVILKMKAKDFKVETRSLCI